ncbi:response regulator [Azospirillum halopraeferens]|uniref:response regulator n=1 Tax=Azospirillum halopraeferens TaxID=34010 RepID=UPI0003FC4665|nr:response regulator [Azospirillum halopraeferens]
MLSRPLRRILPGSLRLRLLVIVLGTLLLPFGGSLLHLDREADRRLEDARALAVDLTNQGVRRQEELIGTARTLLSVLSLVPEIRDAAPANTGGCTALLRRLPEQQPWTTGAWVAGPDGTVICDTSGAGDGLGLGDREYFRRAVTTGEFVLSGYIVGRRSGERLIMAVLPLMRDGTVERVLGVSIGLDWYADLIGTVNEDGMRLSVVDARGVILARQPDAENWVGRSLADVPHVQHMLANENGVLIDLSADGVRRAWSFRRLAGTDTTFAVGVPLDGIAAAARRDLLVGAGFSAAAAALGFLLIWSFTRASVLNWMQALTAGAERIGAAASGTGGSAARVDVDGAPREIAAVGIAFNRMAERLAAREREVEEARRSAEAAGQAARCASQRLSEVLECTSDGIYAVDRDWRFIYMNQRARDMVADGDDLTGRTLWETLPDIIGTAFERAFRAAMERGEPTTTIARHPTRDTWYEGTCHPSPEGIVVYFTDVSRRVRDERSLRDATTAAESANRAKSEFLATMSHEIRTPMNAIFGLVHLLEQTPLSAPQRDCARRIGTAARSLLGILNDVLDYSKVEAGKLALERVEFRLDELLDNLATILAASAREKDIEVLYSVAPEVPQVLLGDPVRLRQVLINLTGNAIKFTDEGEIVVSVTVTEMTDGHAALVFAVRDTGIGITAEQQRHLFRAFSQGDGSATRRFGGTGLGLAICARLVALMGGAMEVTSEPGRGSEFRFAVCFDRPAAPAALPPPPSLSRPLRVLVADDNPAGRDGLARLMESVGWTAVTAAGGAEAIAELSRAAAAGSPYDVVLVDRRMPGMDGPETSRRIRRDRSIAVPVIVMVTAFERQRLAAQWDELPVDGILVKPVSAPALLDTVAATLARAGGSATVADPSSPAGRLLAGRRLLLVEDDLISREVAREFLSRAGAAVTVAADGREALAAVQRQDRLYDGVLMAVQLPVMDGLQATRALRAMPGLAALPIVAVTADIRPADRERCRDAGMTDVVAKPIDPDRLVATLLRHLDAAAPVPVAAAAAEPMPAEHRERLAAALGRLHCLLASNNFAAAEEWAAVTRTLPPHAAPEAVADLGHAIDRLDFARAGILLERLAGTLDLLLPAE